MGVPVGIEDDNCVRSLQIETKTASTRAQDEDEVVRIGTIELFEQGAAVLGLGRAVETEVLVTLVGEEVFENVHQRRHLAEQQRLVFRRLQLGQNAIEQLEFTRHPVEVRSAERIEKQCTVHVYFYVQHIAIKLKHYTEYIQNYHSQIFNTKRFK